MGWFDRQVDAPSPPKSLSMDPLWAPPGGLAIELDQEGNVLRLAGALVAHLAVMKPNRLRDCLCLHTAWEMVDDLAASGAHVLDLDFQGRGGRVLHTRGWIRSVEPGWLLCLQDISDVMAQAQAGALRSQSLSEAGRLAERIRDCVPGTLQFTTAESLQRLAQLWQMPTVALAVSDGQGWRVYAHYQEHGAPALWADAEALGNGLGRLGDAPLQCLPASASGLAALHGCDSAWLVPYRNGGGVRAWLIAAPYEASLEQPGLNIEDWRQAFALLAGPLLVRLDEQHQQHQLGRLQALQGLLGVGWWEYHIGASTIDLAVALAEAWALPAGQSLPLAHWLEAVHPADRDELRIRLLALEAGGAGFVLSLRLNRPGDTVWQRVQALVLEQGRARRIVGFALDISDIKREEERATTAHARLRNLVASAPAVIYVQDYAGGALELAFCSDSLAPLLGWSLADLLGAQLAEKVHPEDLDTFFFRSRELLREGSTSCRYRLRDRRGDYHWLLDEAKLLRDELGLPREAVGLWLDVTEATLAAERVRESEERYRILVEDSPAMICRYTPDLCLTFANRPLADYLEREPHELIGACLGDWLSEDQRQVFNQRLIGLTPEAPLSTAEICLQLPGRQHAWWIWADRGVFDEHGRLCEVQAVGRDNTEVRQAQQQLFQGAKMATLGEMATGMAHEMNQPLHVMRMAVANVLKRLAGGDVPAQYLEDKLIRIEAQVQRAARIVDHMRVFGRRSEIEQQVFDPLQAMEGALSLLSEGLVGKGLELRAELPTSTAQVQGHADQLEQVLINLMVNARDAMLSKWEHEPTFKPWLCLRATVEEGWVRLWVEDNGGGIEPRIMQRIFEPFFTTKPVGKGTGLGLSVSYGIVQQMGGNLSVENAEQGARFCVALPCVERTTEEPLPVG